MHKDHKYIDKIRNAAGTGWRYIYDIAKDIKGAYSYGKSQNKVKRWEDLTDNGNRYGTDTYYEPNGKYGPSWFNYKHGGLFDFKTRKSNKDAKKIYYENLDKKLNAMDKYTFKRDKNNNFVYDKNTRNTLYDYIEDVYKDRLAEKMQSQKKKYKKNSVSDVLAGVKEVVKRIKKRKLK